MVHTRSDEWNRHLENPMYTWLAVITSILTTLLALLIAFLIFNLFKPKKLITKNQNIGDFNENDISVNNS